MDLSPEGVPLLIVFLLPGFVTIFIGQYLGPVPQTKLSNIELGLLSLAYSTVISVTEGLLFALILPVFEIDLKALIATPQIIFATYPAHFLAGLLLWIALGLGMGYVLGLHDPFMNNLRKRLWEGGKTDEDIWSNTFDLERQAFDSGAYITVQMKSGDIFAGYLREYNLTTNEDGNREFRIVGVNFRPGPHTSTLLGYDKGKAFGDRSAALLNTRDVDAIHIFFQ